GGVGARAAGSGAGAPAGSLPSGSRRSRWRSSAFFASSEFSCGGSSERSRRAFDAPARAACLGGHRSGFRRISVMKERPAVAYFLALGAAILYGVSDFAGGLASRKKTTLVVFFFAQAAGLVALATIQALLPAATPTRTDVLWGAAAGFTGGVGVALLYHALAIGAMAVVAPTTAVCAVAIPVVISVLLGERPSPLGIAGIALAIGAIILVSH